MTRGQIVGGLACQKDSYLRTLDTEVISCVQISSPKDTQTHPPKNAKSTNLLPPSETDSTSSKLWMIEFADSVLFPEGGGQPTDYGSLLPLDTPSSKPIPIRQVQREGLRCVCYSPQPLIPGTLVRQDVDFSRRWDHMQQHTGQHLITAIMNTHDNLATIGWSMGAEDEMSYVKLARNPSQEEIRDIQRKCNEVIRSNLSVRVETPDNAKLERLPDDYDKENGVVRVVKIGDIDADTCCGTHLAQTSHLSLILLHHTQQIGSSTYRLFFTAGDRAIKLATNSIDSLRFIARTLSSGNSPPEVVASVERLNDNAAESKRREKKLLMDIAKYEGDRVKTALKSGKNALVYRAEGGMEFISFVLVEIKEAIKDGGAVILASGQVKREGPIVIVGEKNVVGGFARKVNEVLIGVKGGGREGRWQGKVGEWRNGDLEKLNVIVES